MRLNANVLNFDLNNNVEDFTFILSTKSGIHLGKLNNVKRETIHFIGNLNTANEISFEVQKYITNEYGDIIMENLWDDITDLKSVWVKELNEYFQIQVSNNDSVNTLKTITGISLCEAELSQRLLYDIEINTEADIERDNYEVTKFYNKDNYDASLLHRILKDKACDYSIEHVDPSLANLQRSFSISGTSIYDFLTGECAEQFNCLFVFDSTTRSISAYDLYTVCQDCGHRGDFSNACPECNNTNITYFGEDTTIFVNKENFASDITFETDVDSIKNCFKMTAGDDYMTATIANINTNGTSYIIAIPDEQKQDMSSELGKRIEEYEKLCEDYAEKYEQIIQDIYDYTDGIHYYEFTMMPSSPSEDETIDSVAENELLKLTEDELSTVAVSLLTPSTSSDTVNSAIKSYVRTIVNTGKVKIDVDGEFDYVGEDENGWNYGEWIGSIVLTNYSDEDDVASLTQAKITINNNYGEYIAQKIRKDISNDDEEGSIYNVLKIENLDEFKAALELYCLERLKSFSDAIQTAIDVLVALDQATEYADFYNDFYLPYYNKLIACEEEILKREQTISEIQANLDNAYKSQSEIHLLLNFENYLGEDLYKEFSAYRREDEYNNSNFISDGLSNTEIIKNAKEFIKLAKNELVKSATRQHSISCNLYNLLAMKEFEILREQFVLGNFIRVQCEDNVYRLRLIKYEINFSDLNSLPVEFSDMTQSSSGTNDIRNILQSAQSMSTTFASISKQAEKGADANSQIKDLVGDGRSSALIAIKNNDFEEVTYGKHGLFCKTWDDITGDYSPEWLRITHNIICFTDDNGKTYKQSLGKHNYYTYENGTLIEKTGYGMNADFCQGSQINGAQFIGGEIYSRNYSPTSGTYFNLDKGSISIGGGALTYSVDNGLQIKTVKELEDRVELAESSIIQHADSLALKVSYGEVSSQLTIEEGEININSNRLSINSDNFTLTLDGTMTAKAGKIGKLEIDKDGVLVAESYNDTVIDLSTFNDNYINIKYSYKQNNLLSGYNHMDGNTSLGFDNLKFYEKTLYDTPQWTIDTCPVHKQTTEVSYKTNGIYMNKYFYMNDENGLEVCQTKTSSIHFIDGTMGAGNYVSGCYIDFDICYAHRLEIDAYGYFKCNCTFYSDVSFYSDITCYSGQVTISNNDFAPLTITRNNSTYHAGIEFTNSNGTLGYISMASVDGDIYHWYSDAQTSSIILDTYNYKHYVVPNTGGKFTGTVDLLNQLLINSNSNASSVVLTNGSTTRMHLRYDSDYFFILPWTSSGFDVTHSMYISPTTGAVSVASLTNRSSKRFKDNISNITEDVANRILDVNIVHFDYKPEYGDKDMYGVIAEDVLNVHPNAVILGSDNLPEGVDYTRFIPLLIKKTQMQEKEINNLKDNLMVAQATILNLQTQMINK